VAPTRRRVGRLPSASPSVAPWRFGSPIRNGCGHCSHLRRGCERKWRQGPSRPPEKVRGPQARIGHRFGPSTGLLGATLKLVRDPSSREFRFKRMDRGFHRGARAVAHLPRARSRRTRRPQLLKWEEGSPQHPAMRMPTPLRAHGGQIVLRSVGDDSHWCAGLGLAWGPCQ